MTQEDKELLEKDLCGRLPYFPNVEITIGEKTQTTHLWMGDEGFNGGVDVRCIKPYLRPLSKWYMTAEEENFYYSCLDEMDGYKQTFPVIYQDKALSLLDFLNAHHFDYRGLIEKGLALEAPVDMYKTE